MAPLSAEMHSNIYQPPRIRGHLVSLLASLCSYLLHGNVSLVYLFCIFTQDNLLVPITFVCIITSCLTWEMKGLPELIVYACSLEASSVFVSYLQIRHFITLFELFKQPSCPEGQIEKNHQCSNLNSSPGVILYLIVFFFILAVDLILIPVTGYFLASFIQHKWKIRKVKFISPMIDIIASTSGMQTEDCDRDHIIITSTDIVVLSIIASWILLVFSSLTFYLCAQEPNSWINLIGSIFFGVAICSFKQKALLDLVVCSTSLSVISSFNPINTLAKPRLTEEATDKQAIFTVLSIVQAGLHYHWIDSLIKRPSCGTGSPIRKEIKVQETKESRRYTLKQNAMTTTGILVRLYLLFQLGSLILTVAIVPFAYYLNIKLFLHRWVMRRATIINAEKIIMGKDAAVQTDSEEVYI